MDGIIIKPIEVIGIDVLLEKLEKSVIFNKSIINMIKRKSGNSILIFDKN